MSIDTNYMKELRAKRRELRDPFEAKIRSLELGDNIDTVLKYLKSQEPASDNLFFRCSIIGYEWGDVQRAIVYANRFFEENSKVMFRDGFKDKSTILAEGKLAMADLFTQLHLLCISLDWDIDELRKLGIKHLEERQKDFERDGWAEVKK